MLGVLKPNSAGDLRHPGPDLGLNISIRLCQHDDELTAGPLVNPVASISVEALDVREGIVAQALNEARSLIEVGGLGAGHRKPVGVGLGSASSLEQLDDRCAVRIEAVSGAVGCDPGNLRLVGPSGGPDANDYQAKEQERAGYCSWWPSMLHLILPRSGFRPTHATIPVAVNLQGDDLRMVDDTIDYGDHVHRIAEVSAQALKLLFEDTAGSALARLRRRPPVTTGH